jgi:hypothetical protein
MKIINIKNSFTFTGLLRKKALNVRFILLLELLHLLLHRMYHLLHYKRVQLFFEPRVNNFTNI